MEKYSTWRDAPTGIAPFIAPKVARRAENQLAGLALVPVCWVIAVVRLLLIVVLLGVKALLVDVLLAFVCSSANWLRVALMANEIPWPVVYDLLSHAANAGTCRAVLAICGFYYIQSEMARPRNKPSLQKTAPLKQKLIISNWSSPIDIFYLSFRYNCKYFLLPVLERKPDEPSPKKGMKVSRVPVIGVVRVGFFTALMRTGQSAYYGKQPNKLYPTLYDALNSTRLQMAILPEGTTSNNRGLLRFLTIPLGGIRTLSPQVRIVSLKYEPPTPLLTSVAAPVPSLLNPLGHLFRINATLPLPRSLLVRALPESDNPKFAGGAAKDSEFWQQAMTGLAAVARLKATSSQGSEEKSGYLTAQRS